MESLIERASTRGDGTNREFEGHNCEVISLAISLDNQAKWKTFSIEKNIQQ
jgi:hypothetical protein